MRSPLPVTSPPSLTAVSSPESHTRSLFKTWGWKAPLAIFITFLSFAWMTWAHWGNLRIDSGKEMYVPHALANGQLLYRDLFYPYGPLAPYWNALLFRIFGSHLNVLYFSGLILTLISALLLFALSLRFVSHLTSYLTVLCFLAQAFLPELFNWVLPYSYAAPMGSTLALLFLYFLVRHIRNESGSNLVAAGLAAGLALLTKIEFGASCYLTFAFFLICQTVVRRPARDLVHSSLQILPGLLLTAAIYGSLAWRLTPSYLLGENFHRSEFLVRWAARQGLRFEPQEVMALTWLLLFSLGFWFLLAYVMGRLLVREWMQPILVAVLAAGLILSHMLNWGSHVTFPLVFARLLLFPTGMYWLTWVLIAQTVIQWWRSRFQSSYLALGVVCFYAAVLGLRIMSEVRPNGYAIYYDQILYLVFLLIVTRLCWKAVAGVQPQRQETVVTTVLLILGWGILSCMYPWRGMQAMPLQTDRGTIYVSPGEAKIFPLIINFIQQQKAQNKKILILPEETSLYFLSGIEAPNRWYSLLPGVLETERREREYIAELERLGIDFILLSNRTTEEYGLPFFGLDYNQEVYHWIQANYEVVGEFGHFSRETPKDFGMRVYRRRTSLQ